MSLKLYVGFSGQVLDVDTGRISSLEALRSWVAQKAAIQPGKQVFLTNKGRSVRAQTLLTEDELFVFDSSLLTPLSARVLNERVSRATVPDLSALGSPPDATAEQTSLQSWQALFEDRQKWALSLYHTCDAVAADTQTWIAQDANIVRSLGVAVSSLQIHSRSAEQKLSVAEAWCDQLEQEQEKRLWSWEDDLRLLAGIPAIADFAQYITTDGAARRPSSVTTLQGFLDVTRVRSAASSSQDTMTMLAKRLEEARNLINDSRKQGEELLSLAEQMRAPSNEDLGSEPEKLMEEIEIILRKMTADLEHVRALQANSQSVSQASKMALLHTRNYLPNLQEYRTEMSDIAQRTAQKRNTTAEQAMQYMQDLARIESQLSNAYATIKGLEVPKDDQQALNLLNVVHRLPHVYGHLLIEAVRRREWTEKMKADSSTLAEEMASYQAEEERRRKKWLNAVDDVVRLDMLKTKSIGIEVNLQAEEESWPMVSRQDLHKYVDLLSSLTVASDVVQDLSQALRILDQPTRKQIKHAKAFKNGSMHEAAFGTTSLMLRGEDECKVLQEANSRLEDELRNHRSRVRKLEDLLHRQTSTNRAPTGDVFTPQIELVSSPGMPYFPSRPSDDMARQGYPGSRRHSSIQMHEEKRLAQRIVSLEADLNTAKGRNVSLEKEAQDRGEVDEKARLQIEEAVSTKRDIMENMEAQQREFADERRNLEQDLAHARTRTEELEDELDRLLGSRDNERSTIDARSRNLETELESVRAAATQAQDELRSERSRAKDLADQLQASTHAASNSAKEVEFLRDMVTTHAQALQDHSVTLAAAHAFLSPATSPPESLELLVVAIQDLSRKSAAHVKELSDALAMARSEIESMQSQISEHAKQVEDVQQKHTIVESELAQIKTQFASATAKAESLSAQLSDEREQSRALQSRFADGETGSDVLKQRLEEEEAKVGGLREQLAEARSHANSLDVETMRVQKALSTAQTAHTSAQTRLDQRSFRSKALSQHLFAQNARLLRLLESLGFAVSTNGGDMLIERASKVGTSMTLTDPSASLVRAISMTTPPPLTRKNTASLEDAASLSFLQWSAAPSAAEEESAYEEFMRHISLFSTETFSEAITKRLRDFEYTARKWQKEAKGYKEKSHRFQGESAAKIAVRDFKEGDLALFLPTKSKAAVGAWAAFNINAPHHFLREREGMGLVRREWLVARISKIEERVVDLGKSLTAAPPSNDGRSVASTSTFDENENPFELSDGLTWYLVHAAEEKGGAPTTPGLGKSTVAAANVDAQGSSIRVNKGRNNAGDASRTLNKSLDSRRSSAHSRTSSKGVLATPMITSAGAVAGPSGLLAPQNRSLSGQNGQHVAGSGPVHDGVQTEARQEESELTGNGEDQEAYRQTQAKQPQLRPPPTDGRAPSSSTQEFPSIRTKAASRSASPSKSVRSLARHLERPDTNTPGLPRPGSSDSGVKQTGGGGEGSRQKSPTKSPVKNSSRSPDKVPTRVAAGVNDQHSTPSKEKRGQGGGGGNGNGNGNGNGSGWESLWQLDYEIASPSPKK